MESDEVVPPPRYERSRPVNVAAERAVRDLLAALGHDVDSDRWRDTPARVARMWAEFTSRDQEFVATSFPVTSDVPDEDGVTATRPEMIVVRGITTWSMCEHHLLPFECEVAIGYVPMRQRGERTARVLGLSKLARIARAVASREPTMQEDMTLRIAAAVSGAALTPDVAVIARGVHYCMRMRGVRAEHAETDTSVMWGLYRADASARAEFLALARGR